MDPLTQGALGAAATAAVLGRRASGKLILVGALGGMAADLDVLIRSDNPLVGWEYHRHFTHSLAFVPFGGALVGIPFALREPDPQRRPLLLLAAWIGYATHGLLDACTTYGTLLWWPFSRMRVAWSFIAIIDPIYTLTLVAGIWLSLRHRSVRPARLALLLTTLYLAFGALQHDRARARAHDAAVERGHTPARLAAFPATPFHLVWRTVYADHGTYHVDAVRTPWWSAATLSPGGSVPALPRDTAATTPATRDALDTFRWFARGYVARSPEDPEVIGDLRYSADVAGLVPMWGIRLRPGQTPPVERVIQRGPGTSSLTRRLRALRGR